MKHIFIDMDGTLCEFNIRGSVILENWFEPGIFRSLKPVYPMINKLNRLNKRKDITLYIMSVSPSKEATDEKIEWLQRYMPFIKKENEFFICSANRKVEYLNQLCTGLDRSNVYLIDDTHEVLESVENAGYNPLHTSTFLARDII